MGSVPVEHTTQLHMEKPLFWNGMTFVEVVGNPNMEGRMHGPCRFCAHRHVKCEAGCPFAPFFPPGGDSERKAREIIKHFGTEKINKQIGKHKPPISNCIIRGIIFESDVHATNPVGGVHLMITELQRQIQLTIDELGLVQRANEQYRPSTSQANERNKPSCSTSGGGRITNVTPTSAFNFSDAFFMCRYCQTHIALNGDFSMFDTPGFSRGIFKNVINLHASEVEPPRDGPQREANLYCDGCMNLLGFKIVEVAEGHATKDSIVLELGQLLLWNGNYPVEALPTQIDTPGVGSQVGEVGDEKLAALVEDFAGKGDAVEEVLAGKPAPLVEAVPTQSGTPGVGSKVGELGDEELAALVEGFAGKGDAVEEVLAGEPAPLVILDDNGITQDQIWDSVAPDAAE